MMLRTPALPLDQTGDRAQVDEGDGVAGVLNDLMASQGKPSAH
jgi:hypothetical protein